MSKAICVMGESGSGKTTAMRTLDPASTLYIDCDGKGLSWKGWKTQYSEEAHNYLRTDHQDAILKFLEIVDVKHPETKVVVIDTINSIMIADERRRQAEKTYDKWADLAWSVYDLVTKASRLRDDLTIIFIAHVQTEVDDMTGERFTRILTNGKKLNKIGLEKYFTTVFFAKQTADGYVFETSANKSTAKTPMGAFSGNIPNDMKAALDVLADY